MKKKSDVSSELKKMKIYMAIMAIVIVVMGIYVIIGAVGNANPTGKAFESNASQPYDLANRDLRVNGSVQFVDVPSHTNLSLNTQSVSYSYSAVISGMLWQKLTEYTPSGISLKDYKYNYKLSSNVINANKIYMRSGKSEVGPQNITEVSTDNGFISTKLAGYGNAYACVDSTGKIFRKNSTCI